MRYAHPFYCTAAAWACLGFALPAAADNSHSHAPQPHTSASVFSPSAPTLPLQHESLPASSTIVGQPGDWKAANAAVAQFPRGHADVIKWEKAQAPVTSHQAAPAHGHHQHGVQP